MSQTTMHMLPISMSGVSAALRLDAVITQVCSSQPAEDHIVTLSVCGRVVPCFAICVGPHLLVGAVVGRGGRRA